MGDHVVGSVADREVAGMVAHPPQMAGAPSVWTVFFYVEDLDDTVASISSAGGRVLQEPLAIPNGARVSVVADPGGAMFALISDRRQPGPYLSHVVGAVSWIELMPPDAETAEDFYRRVFGWDATTENAGGTLHTVFSLDDTPVGGLADKPTDVSTEVPAAWSVWFTVADCAATARLAANRGGRIIRRRAARTCGPARCWRTRKERPFKSWSTRDRCRDQHLTARRRRRRDTHVAPGTAPRRGRAALSDDGGALR